VNLRRPDLKLPDLGALRAKLPGGSRSAGSGEESTNSGGGRGGVKAPDFLLDLYYDLRERRLLPLVALVLVAIVATPFLLGRDSEAPEAPAPPSAVAGGVASAAGGARLTVVESTPGLRDYRKRLRGTPTDPFIQKYTGVPATSQLKSTGEGEGGGEVGGESASSGGGETVVSTETPPSGGDGGSSPGGSGSAPPAKGGDGGGNGGGGGTGDSKTPPLIEFVFDIQISRTETTADGKQKMGEPEVRRKVPALTQLPGRKTPVVTVGGLNLHNGKVVFLVSDDVRSLDGDFTCLARTPSGLCELLEMEPGFPLELVYSSNEVRYRIKVTKIDAVPAGHVGDERKQRGAFNRPVAVPLPVP
jgi:hypothetical protein